MSFWNSLLGIGEEVAKFTSKLGIPGISQAAGLLSFGADRMKDLNLDLKMSGFATDIGGLKDGLANANSRIDAQGKALKGQIDGVKSELEGALKQQGQKFEQEVKNLDAKIAQAQGETKRELENQKKALAAQKQELESKIQEVTKQLTKAQEELKKELEDFKNEVNERFEQQEKKILENKRKIEEERRQREAEIREVKDKISTANTKINNLQQEKDELQDDFNKYQFQTNQKLAETQEELENTQSEFQSKLKLQETKYQNDLEEAQENFATQTKILDAQIKDNREALAEQEEKLGNVKYEQKKFKLEQQQIFDELSETNDLLFNQQYKLNLVSQQMEDIQEEVHERMDKLSQKLDDRINETLNIAQDTNKKVDRLTEQVKNIEQKAEQLSEQIKKNKEETKQAKKEAQWANERLDNYIQAQKLLDFTSQQSALDKIQKSLTLKAEEAKLLVTLNLLQETKQLLPEQLSAIDWRVGIQKGTTQQIKGPERFQYYIRPGSWCDKLHIRKWLEEEMFADWGERLVGEHESAPLTNEDQRVEKTAPKNEKQSQAAGEETKQTDTALEKIEELKSETLARLQEIQAEIRTGLEEIKNTEDAAATPPPKPSAKYNQPIATAQAKVQQAKKQLADQKATEAEAKKQAQSQPTKENKKQVQEEIQTTKQATQELQQAQTELNSLQNQQEFQESLEKFEEETTEKDQAEIEQQWQTIQTLSQQALQEDKKEEEKPKEAKEEELDKKLEELVQQLKEMEQSAAASQKTMTKFMLFLIIFLLEYIVYKRNGLPGLIVLNVLLAIAYYYRDTLKEYAELWNKYLLIIGYVMGNVLAYSAFNTPEQEKYRWPAVIGFNLIILGIYGYTLYQQKQEQAKIQAFYQQKTKEICQENNISETEWKDIQQNSVKSGGIIDEYNIFSNSGTEIKTEQLENLKTVIQIQEAAVQKELEIQQQAETRQQAAEIEEKLKEAQNSLGGSPMTWTKIKQRYPEFAKQSRLLKELEKANRILKPAREENQSLTVRLTKMPNPAEEEQQLLAQLYLTPAQFIALSCQDHHLSPIEKEWIADNYPSLTNSQKLQLLNNGLNDLGVDTLSKKQTFVQLNHTLYQEKQNFGLTTSEKESILRLLITTLDLTNEQRTSLEDMGVSFFNASSWHISEEQKQHLLNFGLNRLDLTEEQQANLTTFSPDNLKTFSLQSQQKNILTSLAPLTREDKYSEDSLQLLQSLELKPNHLAFFTNEEILPNPNLDFGEVKNPYLPLKIKFLSGEKKVLRVQVQEQEQQDRAEKIQARKNSILKSLLEFGGEVTTDESENQLELVHLTCSLEQWVQLGILENWQRDILLTCGLKTIPKYNYFELLIFAVENLTDHYQFTNREITPQENTAIEEYQTQILTILDTWKDNSQGEEKEMVRQVIKTLSNDKWPLSQQYSELQELLKQYSNSNIKLNNLVQAWGKIMDKLVVPVSAWENFLTEYPQLATEYQKYLENQANQPITINKTIWDKYASSRNKKEQEVFTNLNLEELINEKINQALAGYQSQEVFYDSSEELEKTEENKEPKTTPPPSASTSRYNNLFDNLNQEEAARQQKKKEREEARKKLEEAELARRQANLSEKDKKLKEQEEKRQKEKELAEAEEKKRQAMKEARDRALKEEQETHLANQQRIIEEQQKAREEAFQNQQKEAELVEQKKRAVIESLEKQNQFAQEQLAKQKELLEKETQAKLAKSADHDQAERQKLLKQQKDREIALENERKENERLLEQQKNQTKIELEKLKEKNKNELQTAKEKLSAEKEKAAEELNRLKEEEKLARDRQAKEKIEDEKRKYTRIKEFEVSKLQAKAWEELTNYSLGHDEVKFGTLLDGNPINYHFQKSRSRGGYVQMPCIKEIFQQYPGVKIKLVGVEDLKDKLRGDRPMTLDDVKNVAKLANRYPDFYTEEEWRQKIKELDEIGLLE